jgi:endo-1,4-beta-xylanase
MKRRDLLLLGLGAGSLLAPPGWLRALVHGPVHAPEPGPGAPLPAPGPASLRALAARAGIKLGVQAGKASLEIPAFVQFITDNFSLLTPGNELKWPRLRPTPDTYSFAEADWMVDFCQAHGLLVHGHNLCWNSPFGNPKWFDSVLTHENARGFLTDYITTVVKRYRGRIESWDVVNEPVVSWSKRPDGLYPGIWLNVIGADYIDIAFHAAQAADPGALRVLNCYGVEQDSPDTERTRELTLELLKNLLKRGVPVQAMGVESHLSTANPNGPAAYAIFLEKVRALGLQVLVTELDVDDSQVAGDKPARDQVVAQCYYDYLTTVVPAGKVNRVIFWTPSDRWDWLNSMQVPKFKRSDGQPHRPGLIDDALQQKSSFAAVAAALETLSGSRLQASRWQSRR